MREEILEEAKYSMNQKIIENHDKRASVIKAILSN